MSHRRVLHVEVAMLDPAVLAFVGGASGIGAAAGLGVMLPMEAGVPLPLPSDLVMLAVGARVGAGDVPLWVAVLAFEGVALLSTAALFVVMRGAGRAVVGRVGPRIGLTEARLARATRVVEQRGRPALAVGRGTPGLRTVTVVAAGGAGMSLRRALPPLVLGSSVFLQLHLFLGYFFGSAARHALRAVTGPALAVIALVVVAGVVFWLSRRGRRAGIGALAEAACPACLALAALSERPRALSEMT